MASIMDSSLKSIETSSPVPKSRNLVKRRSISLSTGVPLTETEIDKLKLCLQMRRQLTTDDYAEFPERSNENSSSGNVSTIVKLKLRSFGRQIHRHMIESVNATNDISHGIPRTAMGDLYFQTCNPLSSTPRKNLSERFRRGKLSLDLEDTRKYFRTAELYDILNETARSNSASKFQDSNLLRATKSDTSSAKHKISEERRLSISAPHLKDIEKLNELEPNKNKQLNTSSTDAGSSIIKSNKPREVSYDEQGQTWEIYGADQDPNALGQAIENHLEKMMQKKQHEQRCFSLVNEYPRQNTCSTKSSSRASHTGEQIFQAARRKFRRRAVSSVTPNSSNFNTSDLILDQEHQPGRRRSRILSYISRILRRSSTSAISARRHNLLHQDSIIECGEQTSSVEKTMVSAT